MKIVKENITEYTNYPNCKQTEIDAMVLSSRNPILCPAAHLALVHSSQMVGL